METLELLNDWLVIIWFVAGILFFIFAIVSEVNGNSDRSIACIGVTLACHARCEVKILKRKMEKNCN
jgi:hypothetical protein